MFQILKKLRGVGADSFLSTDTSSLFCDLLVKNAERAHELLIFVAVKFDALFVCGTEEALLLSIEHLRHNHGVL